LDNYEWQEGYSQRFGIVWVDFETQERILKESATLYRAIVADNALPAVAPHAVVERRRVTAP
jgi:beta-glucosidase